MNCDLKTSAQAWNEGLDAFENAMNLTNDPKKAIKYAIGQIQEKNPDLNFDHESFYNPLIEKMKSAGVVDESFKYGSEPRATAIEKALEKFKDLKDPEKKKMAEELAKSKSITPQNVKNTYAKMKGLPSFTPELNNLIDQVATDRQAYEKVEGEIKSTLGEIQSAKKDKKYTPEMEKDFSDKLTRLNEEQNKALENYLKSDIAFGEELSKGRHFVYQFGDIMKMNLMTPVSLLKNTTGMVGDAIFRNLSNLVSAPISFVTLAARKAMGKTDASWLSPSIASKTAGTFKGNANFKAKLFAKYGTEPIYNDAIRTPNYIDGVRNIRKIMDGDKSFMNYLAAAFKISPSIITRGLGSPDFFFQEMSQTAELNRIGLEKGYDGAELKAFIMSPDADSKKIAEDYAKKVTYKQELPLEEYLKNKLDFAKIGDQMIENGGNPFLVRLGTGTGHIIKNLIMPFTKTPINLLRSANKIVLPEYTMLKGLYEASKMTNPDEKTNKIISTTSDAVVGFHIRMVALNLIAQGLISAGYDDEEQKTKEIVEKKTGGSNRVNINALWRGLTFQDIKEKKNDAYVDINTLGTVGIALGAYAHAYNKYNRDDLKKQVDYLNAGNWLTVPAKAAASELASSLDFTFFSGFNEAARAIKDDNGYAMNKYVQNSLMTIVGGILPSTHQMASKAAVAERPKTYDSGLTFSENVFNQLGYRFAFGAGANMTNNFNSLTGPGESTVKKKDVAFKFDNYWGRLLAAADPFKVKKSEQDTPVAKLYNEMRKVEKKDRDDFMPPLIENEVNVGTRKNPNYVKLDKKQYEYVQGQASLHRMILATPFINSNEFTSLDFKTKTKVLQGLYKEGREQAIKDLKDVFPEFKKKSKIKKADRKNVSKMVQKYARMD